MAQNAELKAQARDRVGKGAARELRRQGLLPAVIYGDKKPPMTISLSYKDVHKAIYAGGFLSHVIDLNVDGTKHRVIPRDYQLEVVQDFPIHVDFLRVSKGSMLVVEVQVTFINEETSPGLKRGGTLNVVRHSVELSAPAEAIPEEVVVDLAGKEIGDALHISSVTLPEGVTPTITDRDFTIATIVAPSGLKSAESEESEDAEEAPGAEDEQ